MEFGPSLSAYAAPSIYLRARKPPKKKKPPQDSTVESNNKGGYNDYDDDNFNNNDNGDDGNESHYKIDNSTTAVDKRIFKFKARDKSNRRRSNSLKSTTASLGLFGKQSRHTRTSSSSASSGSAHSQHSAEQPQPPPSSSSTNSHWHFRFPRLKSDTASGAGAGSLAHHPPLPSLSPNPYPTCKSSNNSDPDSILHEQHHRRPEHPEENKTLTGNPNNKNTAVHSALVNSPADSGGANEYITSPTPIPAPSPALHITTNDNNISSNTNNTSIDTSDEYRSSLTPAALINAASASASTSASAPLVERSATATETLPTSSASSSKQDQPTDAHIPNHHNPGSQLNKLYKRDPHHRSHQQSPLRSAFVSPVRSRANRQQPLRLSTPASTVCDTDSGPRSPTPTIPPKGIHEHEDMVAELTPSTAPAYMTSFPRNPSMSSASGGNSSNRMSRMTSSENLPTPSAEGSISMSASAVSVATKYQTSSTKPFVVRNNRTYISDPTLQYPLPVDLAELHRQSLRTLLLFQLFGGPITSPAFSSKPPTRVLEVGCGSGFWSMMCHRYFAQHGHSNISFTGLDIVPLAGTGPDPNSKPDKDMKWRFVQHDIRRTPWPLSDGEFDLIMVKDMALSGAVGFQAGNMEEFHRLLKPGGVLEVWETDHAIRMLRPHAPKANTSTVPRLDDSDSDSSDEEDEEDDATRLGAYVMTANTPLSAPLNTFLVEYNGWVTKALESRGLSAAPCTLVGPWLLQEAEDLMDVRSKRLAVPLSEVRWEREGVGGVVTKDGKSYIDSMKGKAKAGTDVKGGKPGGKTLTASQAALRRTALETVVGLVHSFEPILREVSGKSQDEWDNWAGKMMNDILQEGGTSWGECLEVGAWSARKRKK
ncbi:hypothetical protein DL764_003471 [Monosporascus ibericus]|uniref:Methyltransferase domain-containing protein n=1 Tax=Monosporascus ibericus TaxID=155417 RepID=A0A4Q4TJS6_9PEZI|nr:hypothetical protein DL764_003471 [Monosporascus ibericus]